MEFFGRRRLGSVVALTLFAAAALPVAAQESFDPSQLDAKAAPKQSKAKAKKTTEAKPAAAQGAKSGKVGGDRQFGELEGWSPGKTPAAAGKKDQAADPASESNKAPPVSLSPSGQPSLGLTF